MKLCKHPPPTCNGLARVTGLDAGTHQRFPAVDGRASALGDNFVDAFFVYGGVAFWRDKGET